MLCTSGTHMSNCGLDSQPDIWEWVVGKQEKWEVLSASDRWQVQVAFWTAGGHSEHVIWFPLPRLIGLLVQELLRSPKHKLKFNRWWDPGRLFSSASTSSSVKWDIPELEEAL